MAKSAKNPIKFDYIATLKRKKKFFLFAVFFLLIVRYLLCMRSGKYIGHGWHRERRENKLEAASGGVLCPSLRPLEQKSPGFFQKFTEICLNSPEIC